MTSITKDPQLTASSPLGIEAGQWLLRLRDANHDPQDPYCDPSSRNEAFLDWLARSRQHVQLFLEVYETYRRLGMLGPRAQIEIRDLLQSRNAEVIRIYGTADTTDQSAEDPVPLTTPIPMPARMKPRVVAGTAAAIAMAAGIAMLAVKPFDAQSYSTQIGEQRTCKLDDGSMVYLNTDSRLVVDFSKRNRSVRLMRGEALFAVQPETRRPFVVTSGNVVVRALGTKFNVRARAGTTDVAVVEGAVQVTATAASSASSLRLSAGEEARITRDKLAAKAHASISESLAWRERRLIFHDASLAEAAAEFNRYNAARIQVEPSVSARKRLTGIFDADRPQALVLYAAQDDALTIETVGKDWVIRSR